MIAAAPGLQVDQRVEAMQADQAASKRMHDAHAAHDTAGDGHAHDAAPHGEHGHAHEHGHVHEHGDVHEYAHDEHAHGGVESVAIVLRGAMDLDRLNRWLGLLLDQRGDEIFRMKYARARRFVALLLDPRRPLAVLHAPQTCSLTASSCSSPPVTKGT